jgi:hypothetical protein
MAIMSFSSTNMAGSSGGIRGVSSENIGLAGPWQPRRRVHAFQQGIGKRTMLPEIAGNQAKPEED